MRGVTVKTPERVAEAQRMRAEGYLLREIAERYGVRVQTASSWICDPDGSRHAARKAGYAAPCAICGGPTDGSRGRHGQRVHCLDCLTWTREAIVAWIQDYFEEHCEPPRNCVPGAPAPAAVRLFGSWTTALEEAGVPVIQDRRPETWEAIRAAVRAGEPVRVIAERYGVSDAAIYERFRVRGLRLGEERQHD